MVNTSPLYKVSWDTGPFRMDPFKAGRTLSRSSVRVINLPLVLRKDE